MTRKHNNNNASESHRLRRLTRAYLTPVQHHKTRVVESTLNRVDHIYMMVQKTIVDYQSVTSGLFPRYSKDADVGYVKDSIYCAMSCWACSIAYNRLDDDRGRQTELRHTAAKTMRGILFSWMQQAEKLNMFKEKNTPEYALHSRFDLATGTELKTPNDHFYGHLQMDLIALYLLALVQMIAGGVQIIYTHSEVAFVQNLVFYIERTYRTPDFGMWERGSRYHVGAPELHASSLGMVKAALEAINGFNVFGATGTSASVIYVDIDGHNRNRTTFETILPRESNSKNTDAALLLAIGWPAFATHDKRLYDRSFAKCVRRLEGRHGLRRYLRDGYRTEIEDHTRPFYQDHETSCFQGIESQFPAFYAYITITALLRGDEPLAESYWNKLQGLLVGGDYSSTYNLVPECYCVDEDHIEAEKRSPNSQDYFAVNPMEFGHHLWSNAVYLIAYLLKEKLIHSSDIDPIYRHLPASHRPKTSNRHSAFKGSMEGDPVVQIALIAESSNLQRMLSTYGISTQTPHEVEPIQIWPSWRMVKVFESLGRDTRMGLNGRPPRPFGPLNTSKMFRVFGDTVLCYPLLFEIKDFYISSDPTVLMDDIKRDIEFVAKRWKLAGRPTFCIVLREENVSGEYFDPMLDLLVKLKNGFINGIRVRLGRVHQLLNNCCVEHIDFADMDEIEFDFDILEEVDDKSKDLIRSKTSLRAITVEDTKLKEADYRPLVDHDLYQIISKHDVDNLREVAFAIAVMWKRYTPQFVVAGENLQVRMERVYRQACAWRLWWVVRYCAAILRKTINSLAPGITNMLVRGKQVTLGTKTMREVTITKPMTPSEIAEILFNSCHEDEPQAAVLQQELLIACSDLISHNPSAFDGVLTIRLSWLSEALSLMANYVKTIQETGKKKTGFPMLSPSHMAKGKDVLSVYDLSPTFVKDIVACLMTKRNWHLFAPLQTRRLNGALNRVPTNLYDRVWKILERCNKGIVIAGHLLPQQPTLSDMTQFELTFSFKIEGMMSVISHPEYRQLLVELLCIIATIMERNPEIFFSELNCDGMIKSAFHRYCQDMNIKDRKDMTPFYQLDQNSFGTSTATYLAKAFIDEVLKGGTISRKFSAFGDDMAGETLLTEKKPDDLCHVS
uniref:Phosphorylase b kinase regulatory subunit n=1 Tax=Steinernema glaseri TaxID=37863 RepID=A0A1I7YF00_9BILA